MGVGWPCVLKGEVMDAARPSAIQVVAENRQSVVTVGGEEVAPGRPSVWAISSASDVGHKLSGADRLGQDVPWRGERTGPHRVIRARRVVGKIEINDQGGIRTAEIGAFDGVEQVPAAPVGLDAGRGVLDR